MNNSPEIVREYLIESYENLDELDRDLVTLEQNPHSEPTLGRIFRTIHTIKGTCGFLGFAKLESVAHAGESLLGKLRDRRLRLRPEITTGLLDLVDAIREILGNIESIGLEGEADYAELVKTLIQLQEVGLDDEAAELTSTVHCSVAIDAPPCVDLLPTTSASSATPSIVTEAGLHANSSRDAHEPGDAETGQGGVSDSTIRVDVGLLDRLMTRVGELVLARNQILQFTSRLNDSVLASASQRLNLITTELQEGVMKTRMQPIGNIWSKFPRAVRDVAVPCGKLVRIQMEGKDTELDKTIIEAIKDPLTHLIRNAVDHGIEAPESRVAMGKPAEGCLRLRAFHEGGQVNIEIADDGAGLNLDRIRQIAVERNIITKDQALRMGDREAAQLIFAPGFSTASKVTNISGRGVGMDVVKTNIERIGGTVDVASQPGQGTTVKLKIPLTLAIIPALIVTCAGDRYAIPQVSLLELVRLDGALARQGIERLHDAPVYRLRGRLLPIVDLGRELGVDDGSAAGSALSSGNAEALNIVVLRADDREFGLVVDSINDTEEIVVKPLSPQLKGISVFAGATIMGDGQVALILDVLGVAQRAHVISELRDRTLTESIAGADEPSANRQALLLLELGDRRLALPMTMVARLEEFPRSCVEKANGREAVQYGGQILPLVRLGEMLGAATHENSASPLHVVVFSDEGRSVGLVVDRIVDVVETPLEVTRPAQSGDLLASAVVQGRVTDLLDLPAIIRRADPTFYAAATAERTLA